MNNATIGKDYARLNDLLSAIPNQWCAVIAPSGSGKTTLATQFTDALQREHKRWRVRVVAFEPANTLQAACRQVLAALGLSENDLNHYQDVPIADSLKWYFKNNKEDVCLILDDLKQLPTQVLRLLAAELRRFRNSNDPDSRHLHCTLFGGMELYYLTAGKYSPFSNTLQVFDLPDLTAEQSARNLATRLGVESLDGAATTELFEQTAGYPSLIVAIAKTLTKGVKSPTAEAIGDAARAWVERCVSQGDPPDPCFQQALHFLQTSRASYAAFLKLLNAGGTMALESANEELLMSGAVSPHGNTIVFRGRMLEEALRRHFDELRQADYWCLHGDWEKARELYPGLPPDEIRQRRLLAWRGITATIINLWRGIMPTALQWRDMAQTEKFVTEMGRYFFGADHAILWRLEPGDERAMARATYPPKEAAAESSRDTATQAARYHTLALLQNNCGVIQGIGATTDSPRWALELDVAEGVPGEWFSMMLTDIEPSLFMILEHARQSDLNEGRLRAQRDLIHDINLKLQRSSTLQEVFKAIIKGIRDDLRYECAQLSLVFSEEDLIRAVASNGVFDLIKNETVRDLKGSDLLAQVYRKPKGCNVTNCFDPQFSCDLSAIERTGLKSQTVLPLWDGEKVVGVLSVGDTARTGAFRNMDLELLQPLADCAAVAIGRVREREAFELAFTATEEAMAIVDAAGKINSCNATYRQFFSTQPGMQTPLRSSEDGTGDPLVSVSFRQNRPVHTVRERNGKKFDVTAAYLKDEFDRYAGGVEVVRTTGPMLGLTEALSKIVKLSDEEQLVHAIVDCVCDHLSYPRVRFYKFDPDRNALTSSYSRGLDLEASRKFDIEGIVQKRPSDGATPGFECFTDEQPLVIVRQDKAEEILPLHTPCRDARGRRVFLVKSEEVEFCSKASSQQAARH